MRAWPRTLLELSPFEVDALRLSLRVGFWSVAGGLPLGLAAAFVLARGRFPGKLLFDGMVHLPLVLPPVVVGFALLVLFGRNGPIGAVLYERLGVTFAFNWKGAALASAVMGFPLMVRAMRLSIEAVDPRLEEAASTLGAPGWFVFLSVTLPLAAPGVVAGLILGFAKAIGEFGATITFVANIPGETQTIATAIYTATQDPAGAAETWRLTVIALAIAFAALVASEALAARVSGRNAAE